MTNDKIQMTNEIQMTKGECSKQKYDLEERTSIFAKKCITICRLLKIDTINMILTGQLVRSSGSVGANYREANDAISRKEFYHRIGICRKEAKESKHWLELVLHANSEFNIETERLVDEAFQLARIFSSISKNKL